jgi:transposase
MKAHTATQNRRKYDEEFKRQALQMIYNGQSVRSVAEALGVGENLLHRWKQRKQNGPSNELEKEVEQLRSRLKQVEMERDILKKALSIFSRQT